MSDNVDTAAEIPSAWQDYKPLVMTAVRWGLGVAGAYGFTQAQTVTGSQVEMAVGIAMAGAALIWGGYQKIAAKRALRLAAANPAGTAPPQLPS